MAIADYLNKLIEVKKTMVGKLLSKGVTANDSETFNTLVDKIEEIPSVIDDSESEVIFSEYSYGYPTKAQITQLHTLTSGRQTGNSVLYSTNNHGSDGCHFFYHIENVVIPEDTEAIGGSSFYNLTNLKTINMPDTLKLVKGSAFSGCKLLEITEIPDTIEEIGYSGFKQCEKLAISKLPDSLKTLGSYAFSGCKSITITKIPDGVTKLENNTFEGCSSIPEIEVPTTISTFGSSVFLNCTSIKKATINCAVGVGTYGFKGCTNLEELELGSKVTVILANAFQGCGIKKVKLPTGFSKLHSYCFAECTKLEEVDIYNCNIHTIDGGAFQSCTSLKKIDLPYGLTGLGTYAFYGCRSLEEASMYSHSLKLSANSKQFAGCTSLTKFIIKGTTFVALSYAFTNTNCPFYNTPIANGTGYVYVDDEMVDTYKAATNWSEIADQIKPRSELEATE